MLREGRVCVRESLFALEKGVFALDTRGLFWRKDTEGRFAFDRGMVALEEGVVAFETSVFASETVATGVAWLTLSGRGEIENDVSLCLTYGKSRL